MRIFLDNQFEDKSGAGVMKSSPGFRDQLQAMQGWFEGWNACEQTVALYSLLQKLPPAHARFLSLLLQQHQQAAPHLHALDQQANDPVYITNLSNESKETAVTQLLALLPLLRPGNLEAKASYLALIPKILAHSVQHAVHIEESKQLLSYSLIHPALGYDDRCTLTQWMRRLEDRMHQSPVPNGYADNNNGHLPSIGSRLEMWQPGSGPLGNLGSHSLPPGIGSRHMALHNVHSAPMSISAHPDGTQTLPPTMVRRSCSSPAPLSPQGSVTSSSGSDDKDAFSQDGTGMKDVPCWLKGLRLHKYSYIFKNMTYEEMMSITEEKLEKMNITKGARHKIVLSIQKLRERPHTIQILEKDLAEGEGTMRSVLNEIKAIVQTPIKAYVMDNSDGECDFQPSRSDSQVAEWDVPTQITRLLGKVCSTLLILPVQEENINFFVMIVDKCLGHEAFSPVHKRRLFSWKQQIQKASHPLPPRRSLDSRNMTNGNRSKWNNFQNGELESPGTGSSIRRRVPVPYPPRMPIARQNFSTPPPTSANQRSPLSAVIKRPSLQEHMKPHVQIQRTLSAPVRPNPLPTSIFGKAALDGSDNTDPDINIRLESLCLSVTEHALGTYDAVPLF